MNYISFYVLHQKLNKVLNTLSNTFLENIRIVISYHKINRNKVVEPDQVLLFN